MQADVTDLFGFSPILAVSNRNLASNQKNSINPTQVFRFCWYRSNKRNFFLFFLWHVWTCDGVVTAFRCERSWGFSLSEIALSPRCLAIVLVSEISSNVRQWWINMRVWWLNCCFAYCCSGHWWFFLKLNRQFQFQLSVKIPILILISMCSEPSDQNAACLSFVNKDWRP